MVADTHHFIEYIPRFTLVRIWIRLFTLLSLDSDTASQRSDSNLLTLIYKPSTAFYSDAYPDRLPKMMIRIRNSGKCIGYWDNKLLITAMYGVQKSTYLCYRTGILKLLFCAIYHVFIS
jgi:hypothetical protein